MKDLILEDLPKAFCLMYEKLESIEKLLLDRDLQSKNETDNLLTIQEVAKHLNLSVQTIYGYTQRREIPFSKKGKRLYFSRVEISNWIKSGRIKTMDEIAIEADKYLRKRK